MRTQEEILRKIGDVEKADWFGFIRSDLVEFLEFKNAKPYLKNDTTEKEWLEVYTEATDENIKTKMRDYLAFAFEKAEDQRALSAVRSMDHYYAWIWLLDAKDTFGNVRDYENYGIQNLNMIKEYLKG